MADKPLSELLPGMPVKATLEDLAGSIPSTATIAEADKREPPIPLPRITFLVGEPEACYNVWKALTDQSDMVYTEDFRGPIYDAVASFIDAGFGNDLGNPEEQKKPCGDAINLTRGELISLLMETLSPHVDLGALLLHRCAEVNAFSNYTFVVRDAKGFDLSEFHTVGGKECLTLFLDQLVEPPLDFLRRTLK